MTAYRLVLLVLHLFAGLWTCAFVFPLTDAVGRERRIQRWSKRLLAICGIQTEVRDLANIGLQEYGMIVSNHVSWLDIFVINSLRPCRFVAKSDIRAWPLIGWLCEKAGTIFIARGRQRDVRRIYESLVKTIHAGERVVFFPEGTTAEQGRLRPFHANLFEAAIEAKVPVQACALRYVDAVGRLHPAAEFVGEMTFVQSVLEILGSRGMTVQLTILPPIDSVDAHRRELAKMAHEAIADALGENKTRF